MSIISDELKQKAEQISRAGGSALGVMNDTANTIASVTTRPVKSLLFKPFDKGFKFIRKHDKARKNKKKANKWENKRLTQMEMTRQMANLPLNRNGFDGKAVIPIFCAGTDYDENNQGELIADMNASFNGEQKLFLKGPGKAGHAAASPIGSADGFRDMYKNTKIARDWLVDQITQQVLLGNTKIKVPIAGWSRGAVTANMISNQLKTVQELVLENFKYTYGENSETYLEIVEKLDLQASLFLVDPVPGPSNHEDGVWKQSDLAPRLPGMGLKINSLQNLGATKVKKEARKNMRDIDKNHISEVFVIRARDENRAMMKGQVIDNNNVPLHEIWLPGTHSQMVQHDGKDHQNDSSTNAVRMLAKTWAEKNEVNIGDFVGRNGNVLGDDNHLNAIEFMSRHEQGGTVHGICKYREELFNERNTDGSASNYLLADYFEKHNCPELAKLSQADSISDLITEDNLEKIQDELRSLPQQFNIRMGDYVDNINIELDKVAESQNQAPRFST